MPQAQPRIPQWVVLAVVEVDPAAPQQQVTAEPVVFTAVVVVVGAVYSTVLPLARAVTVPTE